MIYDCRVGLESFTRDPIGYVDGLSLYDNFMGLYTTAVTVWTLLSQVLSSDHGCVSAVAKLIAFRASNDQSIPSSETGAYCIARDKLDEDAMQRTLCQTGDAIEEAAPDQWLWLGHRVITGDGTTVTMSDSRSGRARRAAQQLSPPALGSHFRKE